MKWPRTGPFSSPELMCTISQGRVTRRNDKRIGPRREASVRGTIKRIALGKFRHPYPGLASSPGLPGKVLRNIRGKRPCPTSISPPPWLDSRIRGRKRRRPNSEAWLLLFFQEDMGMRWLATVWGSFMSPKTQVKGALVQSSGKQDGGPRVQCALLVS